jgi:hypothetical protein
MDRPVTLTDLLSDVARLGIHLEARGDVLRCHPRSAVTPELAERLKAAKAELLAWLSRPAVDDVAWEEAEGLEPCPRCGGWQAWRTLAGNWRCLRCDPPTTARRVAEAVERIRQRESTNHNDSLKREPCESANS